MIPGLILASTVACAPSESIYTALTQDYGEQRVSIGLAEEGLIETWANPDQGGWTILITSPMGRSCIVATGADFVLYGWKPNT